MIKALKEGFLHYADFSGRTARAGFWNFVVGTHLLILLCMLPALLEFFRFYDFLLHDVRFAELIFGGGMVTPESLDVEAMGSVLQELAGEYMAAHGPFNAELVGMVLGGVLALVVLLPTVAITVRRLRDAGCSVMWVLPPVLSLLPVPYVSTLAMLLSLVTLVMCCLPTREQLPAVPPVQ